MAKTREQWNAEIDIYAINVGLSTSAVAEWRLLRDLVVTLSMWFETIFELFRKDVDSQLNNKQFGTLYWYVAIAKDYQEGYSLIVDNGIVKYDSINTGAQIVSQASAKELQSGTLSLKVARIISGELAPLSTGQFIAFRDYINARRSPGIRMNVASLAANLVQYDVSVIYDPLYDYTVVKDNVAEALLNFRNNLRFDAVFYTERIEADIENAQGVLSITGTWKLYDIATGQWNTINESRELPSGYFNWDFGSVLNLTAA